MTDQAKKNEFFGQKIFEHLNIPNGCKNSKK